MIFGPLCIDYHSRAQEIVIARPEESSNNNNALRLLPTPPNFEERNLYDVLEKGDGDTNDGDDRIESSSNGGSGDGLDENGEVSILLLAFFMVISLSYFFYYCAVLIIYHSLTGNCALLLLFILFPLSVIKTTGNNHGYHFNK